MNRTDEIMLNAMNVARVEDRKLLGKWLDGQCEYDTHGHPSVNPKRKYCGHCMEGLALALKRGEDIWSGRT